MQANISQLVEHEHGSSGTRVVDILIEFTVCFHHSTIVLPGITPFSHEVFSFPRLSRYFYIWNRIMAINIQFPVWIQPLPISLSQSRLSNTCTRFSRGNGCMEASVLGVITLRIGLVNCNRQVSLSVLGDKSTHWYCKFIYMFNTSNLKTCQKAWIIKHSFPFSP